ncbi:MAG TPA: GMC family oxidoreductase [Vicinamibacteria bacterium]|nr:GMC family oxidoreductase [Vicinamibacteria bacterium]
MAAIVQKKVYDAVVVGSGITGGYAAMELTKKGLETLVLEAGRNISPERDYVEHVPPWQMRFRGLGDRGALSRNQPIQRTCYACDEGSSKFFVNDHENPYTHDADKPFSWIRGRQVGGRSIMWGRHTYRWSDLDFEANLKDGVGVDWPIRYEEVAPWYSTVEDFVGITGRAEGLPQLPDGKFLPPMDFNCAENVVREALSRSFGGERVLTMGRVAMLTREHRGRAPCHYCGPCERGCATRSYFSSLNATLPEAQATGRLTLRPHSVVESLLYDGERNRITSVRVIDAKTHESFEVEGKVVFLCASALESTRILLNSKSSHFPDGLANSSGELGRNLMDHTMGWGAEGRIPGNEDRVVWGRRNPGIYVPRFRNVKSKHADFLRGYGFQGSGFRERWEQGLDMPGFGADFKHSLRKWGPWRFSFYGFGECLPSRANYVELDPEVRDRWGIPALRIHMKWGDNEKALLKDMAVTAAEMLEAAGATEIELTQQDNPPGLTIHEMGTARMGRDPKTSVLNAFNQAHDVPNLFLTDGAAMTSSSCVNPSITYMMLTARACDYAVKEMEQGRL